MRVGDLSKKLEKLQGLSESKLRKILLSNDPKREMDYTCVRFPEVSENHYLRDAGHSGRPHLS